MIKSWIIYLLGLAAALVFHAYYFGWYSWFVLQLTVLLPLFSLLVSLPAMLRARLWLSTVEECTHFDAAYVTVQADGGFLPLPPCRFCLCTEHVMTGKKVKCWQKSAGEECWYIRLNTDHVGLLRCSAERARVYDYLKLFRVPVRTGQPAELLVKPRAEEPRQLPNLTRFMTKHLQPKPGGGFSEEHEMRPYRPGDMMRDVHWKLSVKTDELIIREAQEPVHGKVLLTLDLMGTPQQLDSVLSIFLWMSGWLLEHDTPHQLAWIDPADCSPAAVDIANCENLEQVLGRLLRSAVRRDVPSLAEQRFSYADWRYHILPEEEGAP